MQDFVSVTELARYFELTVCLGSDSLMIGRVLRAQFSTAATMKKMDTDVAV